MNSATSTERAAPAAGDTGFRSWQVYLLLSMMAATAAVILSRQTSPAALLLLSATILGAGAVGLALHRALLALTGGRETSEAPIGDAARQTLEREKTLALRAIKELDFDHAMGKVGEADFEDLRGRLRARALTLMQDLSRGTDRAARAADPAEPTADRSSAPSPVPTSTCAHCQTSNDTDARFCKRCGQSLEATHA